MESDGEAVGGAAIGDRGAASAYATQRVRTRVIVARPLVDSRARDDDDGMSGGEWDMVERQDDGRLSDDGSVEEGH